MSRPEGVADAAALRVVRGDPTPEELAALVALLASRAAAGAATAGRVSGTPPVRQPGTAGGWPARPGWRASGR